MISGVDLDATVDYICKSDKGNPTKWKLGILSSRCLSRISVAESLGTEKMIEVVRFGLRGWENFKIKDKVIAYATDTDGGITMALIDIIPLETLIELGTEILKIQKLTLPEIKN